MSEYALPDDLFRAEDEGYQDPASAFLGLDAQSADARAKRTDLVGMLAIEEQAAGKRDWRERVQNRLSADGHPPVQPKVISDATKIFQLFRLGGDQGFGWSRERLASTQLGRLRAFSQNADWARKNRDRVEEMLASDMLEVDLRKQVQEAVEREKAAAEGRELAAKEEWTTIAVRLDPSAARIVKAVFAGMRAKCEERGETFSDKPAVALGQILLAVAGEWYNGAETMDDGEGGEVIVENRAFMDPAVVAEIEKQVEADIQQAERDTRDDRAA